MEMDKLYEEKGITKKLLDLIRNQFELKMKRNEFVNEYLWKNSEIVENPWKNKKLLCFSFKIVKA